jgi:nitrite reductase/ring-hydroxylating ferredoxin subunit
VHGDKEKPMTELATDTFLPVGPGDSIPNDFVVPHYLSDRKLRIAVARVDDRLYAFDDLCTCTYEACPLSGGLLTGTTIMSHGQRIGAVEGPAAYQAMELTKRQSWDNRGQLPASIAARSIAASEFRN